MNNILTAIFEDDRYCRVSGAWQYDYGQVLRIQGLNLPKAVEVHFSLNETYGNSVTRIGTTKDGVTDVIIPDSMLENGDTGQNYNIYAFIFLSEIDSGNTEYRIKISVKARPKPEIPGTPEEPELFRDAVKAVNDAADRAETAERNAKVSEEAAAEHAKKAEGSVTELDAAREKALKEINDKKAEGVNAVVKQEETSEQSVTEHTDREILRVTQKANEISKSLNESVAEAFNKKSALDESVNTSAETKEQLDASIKTGKKTKTEIDESIEDSANAKSNLDGSIAKANTIKTELTKAVETASTLDGSLSIKIEEGKQVEKNIVASGEKAVEDINTTGAEKLQVMQDIAVEFAADREQIDTNKKAIETNSKEDAKNKRKIDALWELNRGVSYKFETDSEKAHQKKVPSGAKIMSITKIGGSTIESNGEFIDTKVDRIEIIGRNLFDENQELQDIITPDGIRKGISVGKGLGEVFASANNDNKYDVYYYLCCVKSDGSVRNPIDFFIIKNSVSCGSFYVESDEELFVYSAIPNSPLTKANAMKIQIEKGAVQTEYTPYFKETIFIPESVKKMQGYGMGIDGVNNVLDIENMRFVKKIDMLELGQLTWKKFPDENKKIYYAELSDALNAYRVLLSKKYNLTGEVFENDKTIKISGDVLYIQDSDFMTESDFSNSVLGMKIYYEHIHEVTTAISNENEKINTSLIRAEDGMTITFINNRNDDTPTYSSIEYITSLSEVNT